MNDLDPDKQFAYISYIIFAAICLITFLVLLYITYKVIKKVGGTDVVIPMMLFMLQMSAMCKCPPSGPSSNPSSSFRLFFHRLMLDHT